MTPARADALVALRPRLLRRARRYVATKDAAEDLVQEALLRVWARARELDEIDDLEPYVIVAMRNLARRRRTTDLPLDAASDAGVEGSQEARVATTEVLTAMEHLPAHQALLLRDHAIDGVSFSDLARRHGLPIGTVMSRVARARANLRSELGIAPKKEAAGATRS
ncbi:MAG: sigma-70 family RNA polymerase sigma factor [Pseudomonadota bacterium]